MYPLRNPATCCIHDAAWPHPPSLQYCLNSPPPRPPPLRSMSNPDPKDPQALEGPCDYIEGLATHYPKFRFQIVNETAREETRKGIKKAPVAAAAVGVAQSGFGLTSDRDKLWTKDREVQKDQVREGRGGWKGANSWM